MKSSGIHYNLIILILSILFISYSCFNDRSKKNWIGQKLEIPEIQYNHKKIVVRFEGECEGCIASIPKWKEYYYELKKKDPNLRLIFYVEIIKLEKFNIIAEELFFADDVIFDERASFFRKNLLKFPYDLEYQAFLLDENNEILLFGNPIVKTELKAKYLKKL